MVTQWEGLGGKKLLTLSKMQLRLRGESWTGTWWTTVRDQGKELEEKNHFLLLVTWQSYQSHVLHESGEVRVQIAVDFISDFA